MESCPLYLDEKLKKRCNSRDQMEKKKFAFLLVNFTPYILELMTVISLVGKEEPCYLIV